MIFCNPTPIAQACFLGSDVVTAAHDAFAKAICDLTDLGHNVEIKFPNFITIRIQNRDLSYKFNEEFSNRINEKSYEDKMKKSITKTSDHWGQTYDQKW